MPINFPINSLLANVHKSCSHAMHFSIRTGISVIPKRACAANGRPKGVPSPQPKSLCRQWPTKGCA